MRVARTRRCNKPATSTAIRRRSIQARLSNGAATSQNGSVAPNMAPPRAAGTRSSTPHPATSHAINAPDGGLPDRALDRDERGERIRSEGDKLNGAMSMNHSRSFDRAMLRRTGLTV
jgi:hypothetical protein